MQKNKPTENIKRSVTLTAKDYERLKRFAAANECTVADILREFIAEGFARNELCEDSSALKVAVSQTLQDILPPLIDKYNQKLLQVIWKAVRSSSSAMYFAEAAYKNSSTDVRTDLEIMAEGIKAGADYCNFRPLTHEQYLNEAKGFFKGSGGTA